MKKDKIVVHDELLAKVGGALRRAAKRAREIAALRKRQSGQKEGGEEIG